MNKLNLKTGFKKLKCKNKLDCIQKKDLTLNAIGNKTVILCKVDREYCIKIKCVEKNSRWQITANAKILTLDFLD